MGKFTVRERKFLSSVNAELEIGQTRRSLAGNRDHFVGDVDADDATAPGFLSHQARGPTRTATNIEDARIGWDSQEFNRLFTNRTMALFHARASPGAGPIVELHAQALVT